MVHLCRECRCGNKLDVDYPPGVTASSTSGAMRVPGFYCWTSSHTANRPVADHQCHPSPPMCGTRRVGCVFCHSEAELRGEAFPSGAWERGRTPLLDESLDLPWRASSVTRGTVGAGKSRWLVERSASGDASHRLFDGLPPTF